MSVKVMKIKIRIIFLTETNKKALKKLQSKIKKNLKIISKFK